MTSEIINEAPVDNSFVQQEHEKMVPQSKVNQLIREKQKSAEERGYKQAISDLQNSNSGVNDSNSVNSNLGVNAHDIRKIAEEVVSANLAKTQEQTLQLQRQQLLQQTVNELSSKIAEAEKAIPNYRETLAEVGHFADAPAILHLANSVDNAGEVLYELAKEPVMASRILSSLQMGSETLAKSQIKALSKSIKANKEADGSKLPDEPLSQLKPTNISVGKAPLTASEFANKFKGKY